MKKVVLIILVIMAISSLVLPVFAAPMPENNFDATNVLEDLISAENFDITQYPADDSGQLSILNFVEYCYSANPKNRDNYALYVYLYNPARIKLEKALISIQLGIGDSKENISDYNKYYLSFLNCSNGDYSKLFYKYKVKGAEGLADIVDSKKRVYGLSGMEVSRISIDEYPVENKYIFSGYASGYGTDTSAKSTLKSEVSELETVSLDVHSTYYNMGKSSPSSAVENHIHTAYFAVPQYLFDKYGSLQRIKAEWYEYKTQPIIVTRKADWANDFQQYIAVSADRMNNPYMMTYGRHGMTAPYTYDWGYNVSSYCETKTDKLYYMFYDDNKFNGDILYTGKSLIDYIHNYNKSFDTGVIDTRDGKRISNDLFLSTVDNGRERGHNIKEFDAKDTFNMLKYDSSSSFWGQFKTYFYGNNSSVQEIEPITVLGALDLIGNDDNISAKYLINKNDLSAVRDYQNSASSLLNPTKTVLFRFAATEYMSRQIEISKGSTLNSDIAYMTQQTIFKNFDILQLTFAREGKYTVIPVVSNPIDIADNGDNPKEKYGFNWWILVYIILGILLLIIFWPIIGPILGAIVKLILFIICLPFKLIGYIFKSFKKE